jgi:hypothetical protein
MSNQAITAAVSQLKQEHIRLCKELERVDQALSALGGLNGDAVVKPGKKVAKVVVKGKRKISAAARRKMSEAAKARWAASRAPKGQKQETAKKAS